MKRLVTTIAFVILTANVSHSRDLDDRERRMITESVTANLKDPGSAQIKFTDFNETNVYCSTLNAKNSYGGYVGFRPFFSIVKRDPQSRISSVSSSIFGDSPAMQSVVMKFCVDSGYPAL